MVKKIKDLKQKVTISDGFPGEYTWKGGTSYYKTGGAVHFSVKGSDNDDFKSFHITPDVLTGTNIGIWFNGETFSNVNTNNLPSHKKEAWEEWWKDNKSNAQKAGKDFWKKVQAD